MQKTTAIATIVALLLCGGAVYAQSTKTVKTAEKASEKKECPKFTELLYFGVTDKETKGQVTQLQEWLKNYPAYYPSGAVTGTFTEEVELAVRKLQKQKALLMNMGHCLLKST